MKCYEVVQKKKVDPYGLFWNRFQDTLIGKPAVTEQMCAQHGYSFQGENRNQGWNGVLLFRLSSLLYCLNFYYYACHLKTNESPHCSHSLKTGNAVLTHLFAAIVLWTLRPQTSQTTPSSQVFIKFQAGPITWKGEEPCTLSSHPEWQDLCLGNRLHSVQLWLDLHSKVGTWSSS